MHTHIKFTEVQTRKKKAHNKLLGIFLRIKAEK